MNDAGFNDSSRGLNEEALRAFLGSTGYFCVWYDQVGGLT